MTPSTFVFTESPLAVTDITLGSLLPDIRYPGQDSRSELVIKETDYLKNEDKNFSGRVADQSQSTFKVGITKFFSALLQHERGVDLDISGARSWIYMLKQPRDMFERLAREQDTQRWLQEQYKLGCKPCFVVGYRTVLNARIAQRKASATAGSASVNLPFGTASGVDPTPSGSMDVEAQLGHARVAEADSRLKAVGERIYAICYRKVGFKFLKGGEASYLELNNCWKSFHKARGRDTDDEVYVQVDIDEDNIETEQALPSSEHALHQDAANFVVLDPEDE